MTTSFMFMSVLTFFMYSVGQGEPAMMPVRRLLKSNLLKSGCSSSAMNIVGTPWTAVHFSFSMVVMTATGSKYSDGSTRAEPCVMQARFDRTMPKQW